MTIENTRIDTHFTYVFDDGRVHVLRDNQLVATNPQAAKVLIAAVGEIVELRHRLSRTLQEQDDHAEIDAPLDERVGDGTAASRPDLARRGPPRDARAVERRRVRAAQPAARPARTGLTSEGEDDQ